MQGYDIKVQKFKICKDASQAESLARELGEPISSSC